MTKQHIASKQTGLVSVSRFSTREIPAKERFDLWVAGSHCDRTWTLLPIRQVLDENQDQAV